MTTQYYPIRGLDGCECATSGGRCRRKVTGYINDGTFDKHVCDKHWRLYHDTLRDRHQQGRRCGHQTE